jgi:lipoyl(octanoyl) transferase
MSIASSAALRPPAVQAYLLGTIDFEQCLALQNRLVYEAGGDPHGPITLLLCEHEGLITVGRHGSRAHLLCDAHELTSRKLSVRWINRGGGCVLHTHGQLAVYAIVPLEPRGWTVGDYAARLQAGIVAAMADAGVPGQTFDDRHGVWGRSGLLASVGVAVKNWVAYHGAFINVCPEMQLQRLVDGDPWAHASAGSLVAERQQPVRMTTVREALLRRLTEAMGCDRFHPYGGHPLLNDDQGSQRATARAG